MSLIYSIDIKGEIKETNKLSVRLCIPFFSLGQWMIAVSSVLFKTKDVNLDGVCQISTNVFKGQRYSVNNRIEIYHPVIAAVHLKAEKNTSGVVNLNLNWFTINEIREYLEIELTHFESSNQFMHEAFVCVNIFLKKVK